MARAAVGRLYMVFQYHLTLKLSLGLPGHYTRPNSANDPACSPCPRRLYGPTLREYIATLHVHHALIQGPLYSTRCVNNAVLAPRLDN